MKAFFSHKYEVKIKDKKGTKKPTSTGRENLLPRELLTKRLPNPRGMKRG